KVPHPPMYPLFPYTTLFRSKEITAQKHTVQRRVSPEVMRRLMSYRWPGNVRELRNSLESMMVLAEGEVLTENDIPDQIRDNAPRSEEHTSELQSRSDLVCRL